MEITKDEIFKNYGTLCGHCDRKMLLLYDYEFTRLSCG